MTFTSNTEGWATGSGHVTDINGVEAFQPNIRHTTDGGRTWEIEYRSPQPNGMTRWETIEGLQYDPMAQVLWAYGFRAILRRTNSSTTHVTPHTKLPVTWGDLKDRE